MIAATIMAIVTGVTVIGVTATMAIAAMAMATGMPMAMIAIIAACMIVAVMRAGTAAEAMCRSNTVTAPMW